MEYINIECLWVCIYVHMQARGGRKPGVIPAAPRARWRVLRQRVCAVCRGAEAPRPTGKRSAQVFHVQLSRDVEGLGLAAPAGCRVQDVPALAAGADHIRDKAEAIAADVLEQRAVRVDVRELLLHAVPAHALQGAGTQEGVVEAAPFWLRPKHHLAQQPAGQRSQPDAAGYQGQRAHSQLPAAPPHRRECQGSLLTGKPPSAGKGAPWPPGSLAASQSPGHRQGCGPASWKAS